MMDVGAFIGRPITGGIYNTHKKAGDHLKDLRLRELIAHPPSPGADKGNLRAVASAELGVRKVYTRTDVGVFAALKLAGWTLLGYTAAWFGLRAKERS